MSKKNKGEESLALQTNEGYEQLVGFLSKAAFTDGQNYTLQSFGDPIAVKMQMSCTEGQTSQMSDILAAVDAVGRIANLLELGYVERKPYLEAEAPFSLRGGAMRWEGETTFLSHLAYRSGVPLALVPISSSVIVLPERLTRDGFSDPQEHGARLAKLFGQEIFFRQLMPHDFAESIEGMRQVTVMAECEITQLRARDTTHQSAQLHMALASVVEFYQRMGWVIIKNGSYDEESRRFEHYKLNTSFSVYLQDGKRTIIVVENDRPEAYQLRAQPRLKVAAG